MFKWTKNDVMKLQSVVFDRVCVVGCVSFMVTEFYIHILKIISLYQWFPNSCRSYFWWYASH